MNGDYESLKMIYNCDKSIGCSKWCDKEEEEEEECRARYTTTGMWVLSVCLRDELRFSGA